MAVITPGRLARIANYYWQATTELNGHNKPCITEAPNRIAHLSCFSDYDAMEKEYYARRLYVWEASANHPKNQGMERTKITMMASNPANYLKQPLEYLGVEVVVRLLFGDGRQVRGLQLASNFGPYLHYLQTSQPGLKMLGIDIDLLAVQYAHSIGVNVFRANATKLPFVQNGFDLIFSHNFLIFNYKECLDQIRPEGQSTEPFSAKVLSEVSRVLKPGGIFISSQEFLSDDQVSQGNLKPHPDFQGSWFDRRETPELKDLQVFKKA